MSTDTMYMNNPHILGESGKHSNRASHVARLNKQRTQHNDKGPVKSKNAQITTIIPKTQVLPNGEKPDFGNSTLSRKSKNPTQKKGGAKEHKDVTKGSKSQRFSNENTRKTSKHQQQREKESRITKDQSSKSQSSKTQNGKSRSSSDASSSLDLNEIPVSSAAPTLPSSPLEKPVAAVTPVAPVVPLVASGAAPMPPLPLMGLPNFVPNSIPQPPLAPVAGVQPLPTQHPFVGNSRYPYGNSSVDPIPLTNPLAPSPVDNQMYSQIPMPMVQTPQVNANMEAQVATRAMKPDVRDNSIYSDSKRTTKTKPATFAGASFASKDPVINKLPKPSFA